MSQRSLTKAEVADRLGVSLKQVERYVADGMPCTGTGRARRFPWPECRGWRDDLMRQQGRDEVTRRDQAADFEKARARKMAADADMAELALRERRGELVPLELHRSEVERYSERLAARLKGLSRYAGRVLAAQTDVDASLLCDEMGDDLLRALMGTADEIEDDDDDDE